MRSLRSLCILYLLFNSCVDPLVVRLRSGDSALVVDGLITNDPGPYQVKLFYASKLDTSLASPEFEQGASVWIIDDLGQSELLTEINPGVYQTNESGIRGRLGGSYYARIKTKSEVEYRSSLQVLLPAGGIDSIYAEFKHDALLINNTTSLVDAFSVFIDAHGNGNSNLFRWRWTGTYEVKTYPELRQIMTMNGPIPDPAPCSGYVVQQGQIKKIADCTCCICWTQESNSNAIVSDNRFAHVEVFNKVEIASRPASALRFYDKYYIEVEQLSVSEEVYEFWKLVEKQQRGSGNLFQPNSIKVKGNLICTTDPDKEVLGIFSVSEVTRKSVFFDASQIPFTLPSLGVIPEDCRDALSNGTLQKPPFW